MQNLVLHYSEGCVLIVPGSGENAATNLLLYDPLLAGWVLSSLHQQPLVF